jgi:hypothetical protein
MSPNPIFLKLGFRIQALRNHSSPEWDTFNDSGYTKHNQVSWGVTTALSEEKGWEYDKYRRETK